MIGDVALILTAVGLGGLFGALIKGSVDKRHLRFSKVFDYKERRYQAIAILMWTAADPDEYNQTQLRARRPDLDDINALKRELDLECHNAQLYASSKVLKRFRAFNAKPSIENYDATIRAMKRDLYI